jgi:phospholipase D1/2
VNNSAAETGRAAAPPLLVEGDTCWRRVHAERAAVLVDAADYFGALRSSLLQAERSIFIVGWELNSRTCLRGESDPADGAPRELGKLLKWLLRRKKNLEIRILLWDHSVFYAVNRELFPRWIFGWRKSRRVCIELDSHLPLGASHHEKVIVVDDKVAYCGGIDLTLRRWDTREHRPVEPRRCDVKNKPHVPVHDVQMVVDGEAAEALARRVRERWAHATGAAVDPMPGRGERWPSGVEPDFERVPVGVIRTLPALDDSEQDIREIERSTVAAIARAEKLIYIENQYVTAKAAAEALLARLRANRALEAIILTSREPGGWLEAGAMGVGRQQFMALFDEPHLRRRIHFLYPFARGSPGDEEYAAANRAEDGTFSIHVHAKVLIVDDSFLRIGSSNLNNRSMGFDTECDLGIEASTAEHRRAIAAVRNRLIAEHWGAEPAAVEEALAAGKPVLEALHALAEPRPAAAPTAGTCADTRATGQRRWRSRIADALRGAERGRPPVRRGVAPLAREEPVEGGVVQMLGDPERIVTAERFVQEVIGVERGRPLLKWGLALAAAVSLAVGAVVLVNQLPSEGAGFTERVSASIEALRGSPWRVPLVLAAFVLGGIVSFPILVLIGATLVALGPLLGFVCAAVGTLLAAGVTFAMGRAIGRRPLRRWLGARAQQLESQLEGRGIVTVALLRKVPIAPFTIVNMLIGASGLPFREFIAGTAIGMLPGIAVFALVGDLLAEVWRDPTPLNVALVVGGVLLWVGVVLGLQRLMNRYGKR